MILFWKTKSFWIREVGLAVIFMIGSVIAFFSIHDVKRSLLLFVELFALIQPALLFAYFMDGKCSHRKG
jgi:hypothetical protein